MPGDLDSDGVGDVVVGLPRTQSDRGAVLIAYGPVTGESAAADHVLLTGADEGGLVGQEFGVGGDLTGDGAPDVAVGVPFDDSVIYGNGAVFVLGGSVSAGSITGAAVRMYGGDSAFIGAEVEIVDVNGDGADDLLVTGQQANVNTVRAFYGPLSPTLLFEDHDVELAGEHGIGGVGQNIDNAGDMDADGHIDLLLSEPNMDATSSDVGGVFIIDGDEFLSYGTIAFANTWVVGASTDYELGNSLAGPGDLDGDGYDDALLGTEFSDAWTRDGGVVYVAHGPMSGVVTASDLDTTFYGGQNEGMGSSLWAGGDLTADGLPDLLFGARIADSYGDSSGSIYLTAAGDF